MAIRKDLGIATAYGYAVSKGYTGTEEEFAVLMASYASVGQTATQAAESASASATASAGSAAQSAQSATNASNSATAASTSATNAAGSATDAVTEALKAEGVTLGKQNGVEVGSDSPYYHANTKYYSEQAQDVYDQAVAVKNSIPADYTALSGEVNDLKADLSDMNTATEADEGKALKAKTVTDGKVTEWEFGAVDTDAVEETIIDVDTSGAVSTWAGMSQGIAIINAPIIHKSGKVNLTFWNLSTHSSYADKPFVFVLYRRTDVGKFEVVDKKSVNTPSAVGIFDVKTDWHVQGDGVYYVGVWRNASSWVPYVAGGINTFYKTSAYASENDISIGSTLAYSALSSVNSNTIPLDISVVLDGSDVSANPAKYRMIHFSVDDCVFWADMITNASTYTSAFENNILKKWKRLHDVYGICVTLNCFCSDGSANIANVPTKFADELKANADWLKFAFHAQDASTYYDTDKVEEITASYDTFVNAIIAMTGTPDAIDTITRLGFYSGTLNNIVAIRDTTCGVTGLLTCDDNYRVSYFLSTDKNDYINGHNYFYDADNALTFIHTMPRMEGVSDTVSSLATYLSKDYTNKNTILEFFTHENLLTDARFLSIELYCVWASIYGITSGFPSNIVVQSDASDGKNGKSAYEYAVSGGYTGTEAEFVEDLSAIDGLADALAEI